MTTKHEPTIRKAAARDHNDPGYNASEKVLLARVREGRASDNR